MITSLPVRPRRGTSLPGNEDPGKPGREIPYDDREGVGTSRHACFIRMSCCGLYLNPGYQHSAHPIPIRSYGEPNPSRDKARPVMGLDDSVSTHRPAQRAQPFRWITENDALIRWLGGL